MKNLCVPLERIALPGAAALVMLVFAALVTGCTVLPGLAVPTNTLTPSPTCTSTPTPMPTATPTSTPTATPTLTPTPVPLSITVGIEPSTVPVGQIGTLFIDTSRPATVTASLRGEPLPLFAENGRLYALIGVHASTEPTTWPLVITATDPLGGPPITERRELRIAGREFKIDAITLTQETLNLILDAEAVRNEAELIARLLAPRTATRLWRGAFAQPVAGEITTTYGERRSYNGGPAVEYHGGLDIAADAGVPVAAANAGRVVFAGPLKVRGNVVIIDHGWGLYSGYYHLSEIKASAGQSVECGQTIGLVGSTGLSTGPHLHWVIWLGGREVDPAFILLWQLPHRDQQPETT